MSWLCLPSFLYSLKQVQLQEAVSHLSKSKDREEELTRSLREMEETAARVEKEKLQQQSHEVAYYSFCIVQCNENRQK